MNSLISVIIPHWSLPGDPAGRQALLKCLDSVFRQTYPSMEVIIVNNEGRGSWTEELEKRYPKSRWIHNSENRLFTGAMNQGVSASKGEWVLSLNNDVVLRDDFIEKLVQGIPADEKIGMGCGLLLRDGGEIIDSAGQSLSLAKNPSERGHGEKFRGQYQKNEEIFSVPGACGLYRREMLESLRLSKREYFDETFGLFYEDLELGWRVRKRGWKALLVPWAVAYHYRGLTTKTHSPRWEWLGRFHAASLSKEHLARLIRNRSATLHRHCSVWDWVLHWPWIIAYNFGLWFIQTMTYSNARMFERRAAP